MLQKYVQSSTGDKSESLRWKTYSYLSDFTGFIAATLHVCEPTVMKATPNAMAGPAINAHSCSDHAITGLHKIH